MSPFLRTEWLANWYQAWDDERSSPAVVTLQRSGDVVAAIPLMKRGDLFTSANHVRASHQWDAIWDHKQETASAIRKTISRLKFVKMSQVRSDSVFIPDSPPSWWSVESSYAAPLIDLSKGLEHAKQEMSPSLLKHVAKARRRLGELGEVTMQRIAPEALDASALDEVFDLESAGWKGDAQEKAERERRVRAFYERFLPIAAEKGWASLQTLRVSGQLASFSLTLTYAGRLFGLVTSYDESLRKFSPGQVILLDTLQWASDVQLQMVELGAVKASDVGWKGRWTKTSRDLATVTIRKGGAVRESKARIGQLRRSILGRN